MSHSVRQVLSEKDRIFGLSYEVLIATALADALPRCRSLGLLTPGSKRFVSGPGIWQTGFAPLGDSANYGSEFFALVGQRVGEARRVPLVKGGLNQAATLQQL
jgi:hypothetical protein